MRFLLVYFFFFSSVSTARYITIDNKCPFTTWPGILGPGNPANGGFRLESGESRTIQVDDAWTAGRIWPRTHCDGNMKCATGSCGNREQCNGESGVPPATMAQFTFTGGVNKPDFYDVSLVDGYNIPVLINIDGGFYGTCEIAGACISDINQVCPSKLAVIHNRRPVACKTGCMVENTDEECCRAEFSTPEKCSQTQTAKMFKAACPAAYSYASDSEASFNCTGGHFVVQFC